MNLFKKALVATAIVSACGSLQAATLSDAVTAHSTQGLAAGVAAEASKVRVIVGERLVTADQIVLDFGLGVKSLTGAIAVAIDDSIAGGTTPYADGRINGPATSGLVGVEYGTGGYALKAVGFTAATATVGAQLILEVVTGQPVIEGASFEVSIFGDNINTTKASQVTVSYSARDTNGTAKDTPDTGAFVTTADQYTAKVSSKFNGVVDRDTMTKFTSGFIPATTTTGGTAVAEREGSDSFAVTLTDNQELLAAAVGTDVLATVTLTADVEFDSTLTYALVLPASSGTQSVAPAKGTVNKKEVTFAIAGSATGIAGAYTLEVTGDGSKELYATTFEASVEIDADGQVSSDEAGEELDALTDAAAGEWKIDATEINIPYLPLGFDGTSTSVHFSNTSTDAVPLSMTAVSLEKDDDGDDINVKYASVDLPDLAASSVTKLKQGTIMELFDIEDQQTKLSITFSLGGESEKVQAYATVKDDEGRTEVSNSLGNGIE
jgi:hypothetical protein